MSGREAVRTCVSTLEGLSCGGPNNVWQVRTGDLEQGGSRTGRGL